MIKRSDIVLKSVDILLLMNIMLLLINQIYMQKNIKNLFESYIMSSSQIYSRFLPSLANYPMKKPIINSFGGNLKMNHLLYLKFNGINCSSSVYWVNNIIFSTNRIQYDDSEIQNMDQYLHQYLNQYNRLDDFDSDNHPKPPDTLQEASGQSVIINGANPLFCDGSLQITNLSRKAMQLSKIGLRLASRPRLNRYQYHLIDVCSLPSSKGMHDCGFPMLGGGNNPFSYTFNLKKAPANTLFSGYPAPGVEKPLLKSGDVAFINFEISSQGAQSNLIYSVIPEITLSWQNKQMTLRFSQLASTIAFANWNQFLCYKLQNNLLVKEQMKTDFCA